jgi:hypothetical protein
LKTQPGIGPQKGHVCATEPRSAVDALLPTYNMRYFFEPGALHPTEFPPESN